MEQLMMTSASETRVAVPDAQWKNAYEGLHEYAGSAPHLVTTLVVNDLYLHLEAMAVEVVDDIQQAVNEHERDDFGMLHTAVGADGHFDTTTIQGRDYIIYASPYC